MITFGLITWKNHLDRSCELGGSVLPVGFEPTRPKTLGLKSSAAACFATGAFGAQLYVMLFKRTSVVWSRPLYSIVRSKWPYDELILGQYVEISVFVAEFSLGNRKTDLH